MNRFINLILFEILSNFFLFWYGGGREVGFLKKFVIKKQVVARELNGHVIR